MSAPPPQETRHPYIKKYIIDIFPFLLWLIPDFVYRKIYHFDAFIECPFYAKKLIDNMDKIEKAYCLLSDTNSKQTLLNVLLFRCSFDRKYVNDIRSKEPEYFISGFSNLSEKEIFVDCGAFTGDTLKTYLKYNPAPQRYYLYEADYAKKEIIEKQIDESAAKNFAVLKLLGVSDTKKILHFANNLGEGSTLKCNESDGIAVEVVSLDEDIKGPVTFIKMDIEGSEKEALRGCTKIIQRYQPKLAICIYHYINDLWEIIDYISQLYPHNTRYYIKHHSNTCWSTVLYVLPNK